MILHVMISHSFDSDFSFNIVVSVEVYEIEGKRLYYLDGGGEGMVVEALRRLDGKVTMLMKLGFLVLCTLCL